jgi:hypothetical protein
MNVILTRVILSKSQSPEIDQKGLNATARHILTLSHVSSLICTLRASHAAAHAAAHLTFNGMRYSLIIIIINRNINISIVSMSMMARVKHGISMSADKAWYRAAINSQPPAENMTCCRLVQDAA